MAKKAAKKKVGVLTRMRRGFNAFTKAGAKKKAPTRRVNLGRVTRKPVRPEPNAQQRAATEEKEDN